MMKKFLPIYGLLVLSVLALTGCKEKAFEFDLDKHIGICGMNRAQAAVACGLDYLEANVATFLVPEQSDSAFAAQRAAADTLGLPVYSANGFFPRDILVVGPEADLERAGRYAEVAIRRAAEAGLQILVLGSSRSRSIPEGFPREEAEEQFLSLLKGMAPVAEECGVIVAIEPLQESETNFINTVAEGAEMARRADSPNICVIADLFHMARVGETPDGILAAADKLVHCHIAEVGERTAPGVAGDDFTPYLKALKQIGYTGRISFECKWGNVAAELPVAVQVLKEQIQSIK